MDYEDLRNRFDYHTPSTEGIKLLHEAIRNNLLDLAAQLNRALPDCREKSLAITKLEEAMFWANAAVARHMNYATGAGTPPSL